MNFTLAEALQVAPLNRCKVVAGNKGLVNRIHSVNSFDAPDVMPWLKQGELVFTTGYVIKNDPAAQVELVCEMAKRQCAGLAIQMKRFMPELPKAMLKAANEWNLPLIEIPNDLSLPDLLLSFMRELMTHEKKHKEQEKKNVFLSRLLHGELHGKDAILAQGREFGMMPECGYICLFVSFSSSVLDNQRNMPIDRLLKMINLPNKNTNIFWLTIGLDKSTIILQSTEHQKKDDLHSLALQLARNLVESCPKQPMSCEHLTIGIGTGYNDVQKISTSFQQARNAVNIGCRLNPSASEHKIYDYVDIESYAILQHVPTDLLSYCLSHTLAPLLQYDKENQADLIKTLEVYLSCCGRSSEAARILGVHRNTIHFRIDRIKDLLGKELNDGETVFRLQMALRIYRLSTVPSQ